MPSNFVRPSTGLTFSVILIFKNEARTLEKTIQFVSRQDYPKKLVEIICIDDGSTDESFHIAKKYSTKHTKLKGNRGISYSRNVGIQKASGDILLFIDAHMYLENSNTLSVLNNYFLDNPNIAGVCGTYKSLGKSDKNYISPSWNNN